MADTDSTLQEDNDLGYTTKVASGIAPINGLKFGVAQAKHIYVNGKQKFLDAVLNDLDAGGTAVTDLTNRVTTAEGNITTLQTTVAGKPSIDDAAKATDKVYSSSKVEDFVTQAVTKAKDDLINGADGTMDTLKELADAIGSNKDNITALQQLAGAHIRYDQAQTLTAEQKKQARNNIAAASIADLAAKLNASVLTAPTEENGRIPLGSLTQEGEFLVTQPNERPTNFNANPLLVSVRRAGTLIFQNIGGVDDNQYEVFARTGVITPAEGDKAESIQWTGWYQVGANSDLSGYATTEALNGVKTTADTANTTATAAQTAATKNATDITAVTGRVTTVEEQVNTNTTAIQGNAGKITALETKLGEPVDFVAIFEQALAS